MPRADFVKRGLPIFSAHCIRIDGQKFAPRFANNLHHHGGYASSNLAGRAEQFSDFRHSAADAPIESRAIVIALLLLIYSRCSLDRLRSFLIFSFRLPPRWSGLDLKPAAPADSA